VSVDHGIVTLRGRVMSYGQREAAERIALRVHGLRALANELEIRVANGAQRSDTQLARAAASAIRWYTSVTDDRLTILVREGRVTLRGTVDSQCQKDAAAQAVRDLAGVREVTNQITVTPQLRAVDVQARIEAAFRRSAEIDARRVYVAVEDSKVILTGNVRSWAEREAAEHVAWSAPGVAEVDDRIAVVP
jgi:osmotically-inducible protein OsmY